MQWYRAVPVFLMAASVWSAQEVGAETEDGGAPKDIVVEGLRAQRTMQGGDWLVTISRSYRAGKSIDLGDTAVALGKDRAWHFCLADTQVEDFVRLLVGDGRSQAAGTTLCRPLKIRLGDGQLRATQTCQGGNANSRDKATGRVSTFQTRLEMQVTGSYGASALKLDFENRREPLVRMPVASVPPDIMRWSVKGERTGACALGKAP
ncbi:MAG: hypothetical protein DI555_09615 [Novosphingobium pentaromativorans]|uniref:DUF3617 domain-containing protein n=1 Tax=Novosphingobium pentaromativorans TaxID=205844 RepID=A0A2W5NPX3_9SPHN|nr:MAG: hypothetical protein DI555_09615 [Novosphingobium pentaromativorans]